MFVHFLKPIVAHVHFNIINCALICIVILLHKITFLFYFIFIAPLYYDVTVGIV